MAQQNTNFVRTTLNTGIGTGDTSIVVDAATSPNRTPPDPSGNTQTLVLTDDTLTPTKFEIITYTGRTGAGPTYTLTGVTRAAEDGTDYPAQTWSAGAYLISNITVGTVTIGDHATSANPHSGSAASGANSDITSLTGLTTDLAVTHGGTGRGTATAYAPICGGTTATGAHQSVASVGTSGQVLTSNGAGALPTFQNAGGGGGAWNLIQTQTVSSAVASVDFTTNIDSTYDNYIVVGHNIVGDTDNDFLLMRVRSGGSFQTSSYRDHLHRSTSGSATYVGSASNGRAYILLNDGNGTTGGENSSIQLVIGNPSNTTYYSPIYGFGCHIDQGGAAVNNSLGAAWTGGVGAIDGLRFYFITGNVAAGTFSLYGVSN